MIRTSIIVSFLLMTIIFTSGCVYAVRYDGPYKGKVIDADTKEPIEGVVVLGTWYREYPTPAGAVHKFYDAMETVTDRNGEFTIPGLGLKVLSNVIPMDVLIFKAGYQHIGMGPWESFKEDGGLLMKKVEFEGDKPIIPLRKLTMEERKKQGSPFLPPGEASKAKVKRMLQEINKNNVEIGLHPIESWRIVKTF